jgi:hypothetical protein
MRPTLIYNNLSVDTTGEKETFIAGVILGISGALFVAAIQLMVTGRD